MSESTRKSHYGWLPWALAVALTVLIITVTVFYDSMYGHWLSLHNYMPWENAKRIDTIRAINEFSEGIADSGSYWEIRIASLVGILLLFVVGPTLWMYGESSKKTGNKGSSQKGLAWFSGVVLVMLGLIYAVSSTVIKTSLYQDSWENAAKSRNIDQLRGELTTLAFDIAEVYYLSQNNNSALESGVVKRFLDFKLNQSDLQSLENFPEASPNDFVLSEMESDSSLILYGIGNKEGPDPEFENANGEKGKIQLAVRLDPESDIYEFVQANTNRF